MEMPDQYPFDSLLRTPAPGDRVRIACGELAGLTGVIARQTEEGSCILNIDRFAQGVYVVVGATALERLA